MLFPMPPGEHMWPSKLLLPEPMGNPARIYILDDHPLVSEGLMTILAETGWAAEVHAFSTEADMLAAKDAHPPDMLIIDIQLHRADGRTVMRKCRERWPGAKVIALSSFEDPDIIRSAFATGADAYIIKNATSRELLEGIQAAWAGRIAVQRQVHQALRDEDQAYHRQYPLQKIPRFTRREREILQLIIAEKTTKEIAGMLFLSEKTVETHRSNLFMKLDVKNIAGLVRKAVEWGIR